MAKQPSKKNGKSKKNTSRVPDLVVGLDSEWVTLESVRHGRSFNKILSYQLFCQSPVGNEWSLVIYADNGNRMKLHQLLSAGIQKGLQEGVISTYPDVIALVAHNAVADLVHLDDWLKFQTHFDGLKKTYATLTEPVYIKLYDKSRNAKSAAIYLYDSMLLAPAGKQKLSDIGALLGIPKIELPPGAIQRMDLLLKNDPSLYEQYALTDAVIAAKYFAKVQDLTRNMLNAEEVPVTIGSLATSYALNYFEENAYNSDEFLGYERISTYRWDPVRNKRIRQKNKRVVSFSYQRNAALASECFHGGRNECYLFGPTPVGVYTDYDLCAAYTSAMATIRVPDYDSYYVSDNPEDFRFDVFGFANITFEFPMDTRFPCLPVRTPHGLLFPLSGETCVPSPEIFLAMQMGCKITIKDGIIVPWKDDLCPLQALIAEIQSQRKKLTKGAFDELLWKEVGNSIYGKLAQGISKKRVFDTREGEHKNMPPSKITNAYIAAYTTSLVRAAVSEILDRIPKRETVVSVTTDGLLTSADPVQMEHATSGHVCQFLAETRYKMLCNKQIIEVKHAARQVLAWRTRGQATLREMEGSKKLLAKAGLKPPSDIPVEEHGAWIASAFINRTGTTMLNVKEFPSLYDLHVRGGDYIPIDKPKRLSMEYDWKCKPVVESISMGLIGDVPHLSFETRPWNVIDEFLNEKEDWAVYWDKCNNPLKTMEDFENYWQYRIGRSFCENGLKRSKTGGVAATVQAAVRVFVRAYAQEKWGLKRNMTLGKFSELLTENGYRVTVQDVKNGGSRNLPENTVPRTPAIESFVNFVMRHFPNFAVHKFWAEIS